MCIDTLETKSNMLLINYPFICFSKNSCGLKNVDFFFFPLLAYWTVFCNYRRKFLLKISLELVSYVVCSDSGKHSNNKIIKNFPSKFALLNFTL